MTTKEEATTLGLGETSDAGVGTVSGEKAHATVQGLNFTRNVTEKLEDLEKVSDIISLFQKRHVWILYLFLLLPYQITKNLCA